MNYVELSGKKYPLRFDMRALKEYKALTSNDILVGFEQTTENVVALTFAAIKSGMKFEEKDISKLNLEEIEDATEISDLPVIVQALMEQVNAGKQPEPGEARPS